jgi:hypothetical protein
VRLEEGGGEHDRQSVWGKVGKRDNQSDWGKLDSVAVSRLGSLPA